MVKDSSTAAWHAKFRDPRWQRLRLEVMQRDGFACVACGSQDTTLNVHHGYYAKDREPWDYEEGTLWTLCEPCHKEFQNDLLSVRIMVGYIPPGQVQKLESFLTTMFRYCGPESSGENFEQLAALIERCRR